MPAEEVEVGVAEEYDGDTDDADADAEREGLFFIIVTLFLDKSLITITASLSVSRLTGALSPPSIN